METPRTWSSAILAGEDPQPQMHNCLWRDSEPIRMERAPPPLPPTSGSSWYPSTPCCHLLGHEIIVWRRPPASNAQSRMAMGC